MGPVRTTWLALAACALVDVTTGYLLPQLPTGARHRQLARAVIEMASDGDASVKISIKPKSDAAAVASTGASESNVRISVRKASDRAAAATSESASATAIDDMSTTIKVKAPTIKAPPPKPAAPVRSEAEALLLNGTQAANCSRVLAALQMGANPNIRDPNGRTPLHFMAGVGLAPACVLLVHFGAQLNARDNDGLTPMHMAAGYGNAQTLRVLVAAGADDQLSCGSQGTPLDVVKQIGEYQFEQVYGSGKKKLKKKDEKLEKLKKCVDVLENPAQVREEDKWEDLLVDVMKVVSL